jgi:hypothetical protein
VWVPKEQWFEAPAEADENSWCRQSAGWFID